MERPLRRRRFLQITAAGLAVAAVPFRGVGQTSLRRSRLHGAVQGEPTAAKIGSRIFEEGGNAFDAIVAAALTACVVSPHNCGLGGYGGHGIFFLARERRLVSIDFNSMAPAAAHPRMFENRSTRPSQRENVYGWLAAGVPGTPAGLEMAARYGRKNLSELIQPALEFAERGFAVGAGLSNFIRNSAEHRQRFPELGQILAPGGRVTPAGEKLSNPDLARLLKKFQADGNFRRFYQGDVADQTAAAFKKNGGLVTADDLRSYQARQVKAVFLSSGKYRFHTAPVTAGGFTALQALAIWQKVEPKLEGIPERVHGRVEALRLAWKDRLEQLGDRADIARVMDQLMDKSRMKKYAASIRQAVRRGEPVPIDAPSEPQDGTVHLSAGDDEGNLAALTLTHGELFGARVAVEGLGIILGHGMSRFNPQPGHPNSPGSRKRPLHNMCPTIVTRDGKGLLALGGAGGRKIPNAVFSLLYHYATGVGVAAAVAQPRIHTEGDLAVSLDRKWDPSIVDHLKNVGFKVTTEAVANASAVEFLPAERRVEAAGG